jgi:hypothetical protein
MDRFESTGTLGRPGPIGRWWRIANGTGVFAIIIWIVANFPTYVRSDAPSLLGAVLIFLGVFAAFANLQSTINIGFTRNWGTWPMAVAAVPFLAAVVFDLLQYQHVWGPPPGVLALTFMVLVFGHLGLSFTLAGVFAVPG